MHKEATSNMQNVDAHAQHQMSENCVFRTKPILLKKL